MLPSKFVEALAERFPAVRGVVGEDFFMQAARLFVSATSANIADVGAAMATASRTFSTAFPPAPNCPISAIWRGSKPPARMRIMPPMQRHLAPIR